MIYKIALIFFLIISSSLHAQSIPSLSGPVVDQAGVLSSRYTKRIESFLHAVNKQTGNQIQVLIVDSLEGESIEGYSIKVVDEWKLGNKETDKGVLFLMAMQERRMRIEVGQGLEGDLTDLHAKRIIDGVRPYFKSGEFDAGVNYVIRNITTHIGADPSSVPRVKRRRKKKSVLAIFHIIFIIFVVIRMFSSRGRRGMAGFIIGSSSGGWSSGSSGGGWSGGGGGFSGGGSSGSW